MLEGPLTRLLIRLAAPNITPFAGLLVLVSVDAMVVGRLGRDALAGLSLVFPIVMLSQSMAAGGLGSAVASAIARTLSAGDDRRARILALHGLVLSLVIGGCFAVLVGFSARSLFMVMGARDDVLSNAVAYATVVFLGAFAPWLLNVTGSIARGAGDMKRPALAMALSAGVYILLSPPLTLGIGPFAGLGIAGTGLAFVVSNALGTVVLLLSLCSNRAAFRLQLGDFVADRSAFHDILTVGALGGTNAALSSITALVATGFVGHLGPAALAGYGLGTRLEYLVIPLSFAFGTALVTVVGANIGAENFARARRAAWIGGALSALVTTLVGTAAALFPHAWLWLFTNDVEILQSGAIYMTTVGPYYGFFGLGLALYFASLGAGRPGLPVAATLLRLAVVASGMYLTAYSLTNACDVVAIAFISYGTTIALGTKFVSWRPARL